MEKDFYAHTSCIILSAGSSARMGMNKALLKIDDNKTFIQKITETYLLARIEQIIVVVNAGLYNLIKKSKSDFSEKMILVINDKPELGRFYSLQTGLNRVKPSNHCFFQNIDNPFTSEELLKELIIHKDEADVIIPTFQKKSGHPVLMSPLVTAEILNSKDFDVRIDRFLKIFKVMKVETTYYNILANINSPEEYLAAFIKL